MRKSEEVSVSELDLLVVHGKNIGVGSSSEDIKKFSNSLSAESIMIALAAGEIWRQHHETHIDDDSPPELILYFSTGGETGGSESPSEANAQRNYVLDNFPEIPEGNLIISQNSKAVDTAADAEEVDLFLKSQSREYHCIGDVSVGYHVKNASRYLRHRDIFVARKFVAENIVEEKYPEFAGYVQLWKKSRNRRVEKLIKEPIRTTLLVTGIDRDGKLLRRVTQRRILT